ncbi:MAG TPA: CehA/McbA family metallohydrolase [Myxococcota bacterium]|jgi:hypothetical protein
MFTALLLSLAAQAAPTAPIVLDGDVPGSALADGGDDYFDLSFEVPEGTKEIEVAHAAKDSGDVLDFGLYGPAGEFRGWGGGNSENAIVGELAASRSYLPGPLPAGTWTVDVGKARLTSAQPGYHVEITLRTDATLPPASDRTDYVEAPPFTKKPGFFAGDFHVHSEDSGDARPRLDEIAQFALGKGLDFVVITDHNTAAQVDRLVDAQERNPEILLLPGVEFTTYGGHATGFGATHYVDHRIGHDGRTVQAAVDEFGAQGALFSINHPMLDIGTICIGCAWKHDAPKRGTFHGVEIETGAYSEAGRLFSDATLQFWESLLDAGNHLAALGGSDDHQAGQGGSKGIGSPCTLVFADNLSEEALKKGILDSRTMVKLEDCSAPSLALDTAPARSGDTARGADITISATVTGGVGSTFRFVENGLGVALAVPVTTDPQVFTLERKPGDGAANDRVRAEVDAAGDGHPLTITSYVWLDTAPAGGCGCSCASPGDAGCTAVLGAVAVVAVRRRRYRQLHA